MHLHEFKKDYEILNLFDRDRLEYKVVHFYSDTSNLNSIHVMPYIEVKYYNTLAMFCLIQGICYIYRT